MGKKKKRGALDKMWCYYCDREFEDEKILVQHQKAKHFKCHVCHKKLSTASGMAIHVLQVHKEQVTQVPNAKPGRESTEIEIYGMQGIPPDVLSAHYGEDEQDTPSKIGKVDLPSSQIVGNLLPGSMGAGYPPRPILGTMPPMYNPRVPVPSTGWPVPPQPQPWYPQHPPVSVPNAASLGLPQQPLFPVQNVRLPVPPSRPPMLQQSSPITPPGMPAVTPATPVTQPLFPVVPNSSITSQSSQLSAPMPSMSLNSQSLPFSVPMPPLNNMDPQFGNIALPTNSYHTSGISAVTSVNSHSYASGPNTAGPSIGPPPIIANKAPVTQPATNEVYLVWDDEAMSMEERRMSLLKYQVHDENSQLPSNSSNFGVGKGSTSVEQRRQPILRGHPTAVVQYNSWKGGGLIAVGYEARKYGVKRSMRGDEAKKVCPEIQLVQVPVARGKADLNVYRNAGSEVVSILSRKGRCERASIDEVYLDLTEAAETMLSEYPGLLELLNEEVLNSHVLGLDLQGRSTRDCVREWFLMNHADHRDKLLACGALIVSELRLEVLKETEFTCSAGIAHNKMLAKLASGTNKPAQQTVVPFSSVEGFIHPLPIKKMKQLGGKLGTSLQADLGMDTVGDLLQFSAENLQERYGINTGTWLWNIARGICGEEVEGRLLPKSHGSGKSFPGPRALKTLYSVQKWLNELCEELSERLLSDLDKNKRIAHTLTLHANAYKLNDPDSLKKFPSKSCPLRYGVTKIQEDALSLFHAGLREYIGIYASNTKTNGHHEWAITGLSVSANKIVAIPSGTPSIMKYFHNHDQVFTSAKESAVIVAQDASLSSSGQGSYVQSELANPEIDTCEDGAKSEQGILSLYPDEDETEVCKDSFLVTNPEESQKLSFFQMKEQKEELTEEMLPLPSSAEIDLGSKPTQSKINFLEEGIGLDMKSNKQKRKFGKEQKTPSILRFFHSYDSSSFREQSRENNIPENEASSSAAALVLGADIPTITNGRSDVKGKLPQEKLHPKTENTSSTSNARQDKLRYNSWNYKRDEIDPMVLNDLPPEIQAEVLACLQPQKLVKTVKRGTSISHYFLPTEK